MIDDIVMTPILTNRNILSALSTQELAEFVYIYFKKLLTMCDICNFDIHNMPKDEFIKTVIDVLDKEVDPDVELDKCE